MQLEKAVQMVVFSALVKCRSFSRAAESLNVSVSHISKKLAALEQSVGVKLIERSTRNFTLTQAGLKFSKHCTDLVSNIEQGYAEINSLRDEVSGVFKIACTPHMGTKFVIPSLSDFKQQYPDIEIEVYLTTDQNLDLLETGIDLWITISGSIAEGYVAQRFADNTFLAVASPDYLMKNKAPSHPDELKDHNCLIYQGWDTHYNVWSFSKDGQDLNIKVSGDYTVNMGYALRDASLAGWGISYLPSILFGNELKEGQLIQVLPDWRASYVMPFYGVYPSRRYLPQKTKIIIEYMKEVVTKACHVTRLGAGLYF